MEGIVHTPNLPCQLQLVFSVSDPTKDLSWAKKRYSLEKYKSLKFLVDNKTVSPPKTPPPYGAYYSKPFELTMHRS